MGVQLCHEHRDGSDSARVADVSARAAAAAQAAEDRLDAYVFHGWIVSPVVVECKLERVC